MNKNPIWFIIVLMVILGLYAKVEKPKQGPIFTVPSEPQRNLARDTYQAVLHAIQDNDIVDLEELLAGIDEGRYQLLPQHCAALIQMAEGLGRRQVAGILRAFCQDFFQ